MSGPVTPAPEAPRPGPEAPRPGPEAPRPGPEAPRPGAEAPQPGPEAPRPGTEARPGPVGPGPDDGTVPVGSPADVPAADLQVVGLAARIAGLPVAEHAAVLEAEHQRLHRQLATIDQL